MVVGVVGVLLGAAGLIVALTRPTPEPAKSTAPTYTAAETAAAHQKLCDTYKLAARAVQVDTNGHDVALGRVALTNSASMLDDATANPALNATQRDAASVLANAYRTATADGSRDVATDEVFQAALDDINVKDAAMKKICGGG
ncbi:MAG: hypothetical protein JOZ00_25355 [Mycobacterium sp.]|nr:hypothetical protein [Mycobacterium sp.]MBV8789996.1 hypothetical protein [Mycobacterium sp.]